MKRTPFLTRILSLMGTAVAVTLSQQEVAAGTMHSDVTIMTYMDFAQNRGRYEVGTGVNALLSHIRTNVENGIAIYYTDGTPTYTISNSQGMISFMGAHDGGYATAISPNYIATVAHNGEIDASFAERAVGAEHAINYSAVGVRYSATANMDDVVFRLVPVDANGNQYDYMVQRQSKIFTDISWNPLTSITDIPSLQGELQYHVGGGSMNIWSEEDGKYQLIGGYIIGSIKTIEGATLHNATVPYTNNSITSNPSYGDGVGATLEDPLPLGTEGGDSGSPVFIYNAATGQYEYLAAHQSGGGTSGWAQARGNVEWTQQMLEYFNVSPDMSRGEVHLHAITHVGDYYADKAGNNTLTYYGYATDAAGNVLGQYTGLKNGLSTWSDLRPVKDLQNWYAYDSNAYIQQKDTDLFFSSNLVFNAQQATNNIVLDATVDLGIGYAEFNAGDLEKASFIIRSAEGANNLFNHAGYVINKGAEVHLRLNNPADYMYECRKNGAGDLYIDGTGDTNALLAVGGTGTTYLQQQNGYAAYNVVASSGATVVINDISQIQRDFTFGNGGAILDMNGNRMDWYANNSAVKDAGFSINALTDEALIVNKKADTIAKLTFKESGEHTYLGSFQDTADAALQIEYAGGGVWTLNSIHTNLSHHDDSSFTVANGKVIFTGTNTIHGMGTLTGNGQDRVVVPNDWHYADATMNVEVAAGATFELGSHARLTGNVMVAEDGTFILREGVKDCYEYVEGGQLLEDTYKYQAFYGLHGNISLTGDMLVEYSAGTTANTTLTGKISGTGALTVKAGTSGGTLTLVGDNSEFIGVKEVVSGGVIATSNAALGNVSDSQWLVGKQGWIASHGFTEGSDVLSYIDSQSTGTLALSYDFSTALNLANHTGLFIGAEAGKTVSYGTMDATLAAVNGEYKLGGGGGELVVNFKLTGAENVLVLGADTSSTGVVTLTNSGNDFGGAIIFTGSGITLNAAAGALGQSTVSLRYGNAMALSSVNDISHILAGSEGILLLNHLFDADISTSGYVGLAVGASTDLTYAKSLTVAEGESYRFGVINGATLTLKTQLSDAHDLLLDAQGYQGGTLKLAGNDNYAGNITVQGNRDASAAGSITLAVGRNMELSGDITLANGGTLDVGGYNVTLTGNITSTGGSIINSSWTGSPLDNVWRGELVYHVAAGDTQNAGASMVVPSIRKTGDGNLVLSAANTYIDFYLDAGQLIFNHEAAGSIYGTVHMAGGTTLELLTHDLPKNTFVTQASITMATNGGTATVLQTGATSDHTTQIGGDIVLGTGSRLNLVGDGTFSVGGTVLGGKDAILYVDAPQLTLNTSNGVTISGTLQFTGDAKLYSNGENAGMVRNIEHLALAEDSTFVLAERSGTSYWSINSLNGSGTFQWDSTTSQFDGTNGSASRLVLKGENEYAGHIILNRTNQHENFTHGAYLELAHDKAAQHADITITGKSATGWATLAVNTDNATIKGLTGNEFSYTLAAPAGNTKVSGSSHPTSTRKSILTIQTAAGTSYTYAGLVGSSADTLEKSLDIVKSGAGEQNFTGAVHVGNVTANAGALNFANGSTTVLGDVAVATGSTLTGFDYTLSAGKIFSINAGEVGGTASFTGQLTLAGGQFNIDALALGGDATLLSLGGVSMVNGATQTITLTNSDHLAVGTYTIASGDWTNLLGNLAYSGINGYDVSFDTNDSGHLQLVIGHKNGTVIWDGTVDNHVWSSTTFGASANALGEGSIATFTEAAAGRTVSVSEDVSVGQASFLHTSGEYVVESAGGTATVGEFSHSGAGTVTINSGMTVAGTTSINGGEIIVTSAVDLGTVTGEGTLSINWDANTSHSYTFDNLHTLNICKGTYGSAADKAALDVRNIIVQSGASYVQGQGVRYGGHIIAEGGTITLNAGALTGSLTVNTDSYLNVAAGVSSKLDVGYMSNNEAELIQIGGGTVTIVERGQTQLDHYVVREGTLEFAGWCTHTQQGVLTVESGAKLTVAWGAGLEAELINLKSGATLQLANGANAWWLRNHTTANILVEDNATIAGSAYDDLSYIQGTISGSGTLNLANAASVTGAKAYRIDSIISDGSGSLGLNIANTSVTLTGANSYTSGTVIDAASTVTTAHAMALGSGTVQNAGALVMNNNLSIGGISGSGSLDIGTYVLVLNNDTDKVYTGEVTGKGGILQAGTGSSTFTSAVDLAAVGVQAGHLVFSGPSIGISTEAYVAAGAELSLSGEITLGAIIENEGTVHLAGNTTFNLQFRDFTDNSFTMIGGTGSITYADALMASDITVEGYTLTDLLSNGVTYNLVQTASTLQLTLDNVNRPLVWTGEAGSEWNRADGNWSHKGENGAIFNLLDMAIFDDTAAVKDVTVVDTPFASSMTVSGTGYSFTGALNVSGAFLVESGASATLNTAPAYLGQATVKGDLTLAFGDTWTQDVDASAGTIHKVGTGTLTWDPAGGILQIGTLDVQKGCFMSSSAMEIGTFSLGTGAVALLTNTTTADAAAKNIQQVLMGNNSYFCIQDSEASSTKTAIGEVVMMGAKGEFQDYALGENSYIGIDKLSLGAGITTSTLTLSAMPQKTNTTVYELGFPSAEAGNFAGTIVLKGNYAHAALILSGAQVAAQAVIDLNASLSTYHKKALGINVDNAEIAGLASAQSMGTETKLFSGTVSATQAFNTANITNAATRNLTINTASGTSYTFYGEVMQGVNLTKTGAGTQAFAGTVDSAAVAVLGGTLDMTAATLANGALADVTLHRGGTLQLGSLNVASGNSLTVQGTGMDATATLSGNLVLGGGNLNFVGTTLDTTSAALTVGGSVSLTGNQTITLTDYLGLVAGNSYFLIAGNFVEGITADNFTLSSLQDGYNGSLSIENGGLWLNLAGAANASIWAGNTASYTWSATTYGSVNSSLLGNQTATFDDSAINRNVLVDGQVTAAGGMVFNNNADYTVGFSNINSSLTTPTVTLNGEGTVNMQVALNTDALTVNNGKLVLSDYAVLDSDTAVKLTGDAVMDITSTTQTFTNLSLAAGTRIEDTRGTGTLNLVAAEGSAMALAGEVNVGTIGTQGEVSLTVGVNTHTLVLGDTTLTLNNALVLNANRTISVQGDAVLNAAVTMAGGTLLFDNAVLSDTEAALDMGTAPTKANGGVKIAVSDLGALSDGGTFVLASGDWSAFSASDFSLIGTVYSSNLASFVIQENALVMNLTAHGVWAGTEDAYTWNSSTFGPDKALASTAMAIFDNSAEHKTVSLTESVTVGDILVDSNRAYSITPTQSGLSITGEDFTKQGSGTLEIGVDVQLSGNMTLQGGDVHFAGTTQVSGSVTQSKGSVTFSGDNTTLGDYTINSASTLNIDGSNATLGNLNLVRTGGDTIYINFAGGSASMGSINMGQNALLSFQKPEGSSSAEYSVNGEIFFSLNVWGGASTAIQVDKGVKVTVDSIRNSWGMGGINIDGEMEVKGELLLSSGSDDPITGSGKLTASRLTLTNTGTYVIDVAEVTVSDQMLVNWSRKSILRSGVLTSESSFKQTSATFALEGGSLNLNGTSSFTGGTLQFAGGEMNVQSGTANLANTVEAVNGSVKVTGGDLLLNATTARNLLEGIDKFTMTSGSLDLADVVFGADGANAITLKNGALFTFTGGVVELGNLQQGTTYQIFDTETHGGSLSGWTSLTKENFTLNGMLMSDLGRVDLVLGETGSLSYAQAIYDLVWTGSAGSNAWNATDANWTHTPDDTTDADIAFANGDSVTFASHATVSVAEGVRVNNLALAENVTLTTTDALNVAGSITAGTGSKWTLDGSTTAFTQSLTGAQVDDLKALEVGAGATLQVSGVQGGFTASNISGTGTVELTLTKEYADYDNSLKLAGFEGEVYVKDGKFDLYDALGSNGVTQLGSKLHLGADVHMQIESGKPVIVDEDVLLDASATNMQVHQNGGATLTYTGSVSGERAYEHRGKGTLTFSGDVDLAGFVQTHDSNAVNIFQGASTQIDTLTQGNAITRFNSASATIGTLKLTGGTIQVQGGQLAIDAVHADTTGGTLQVTGGALNFGAGAAQALLGKVSSFTLSSGPLDLADVTFGTDSSNAIVLKSGANFTFTGGIIALGEMQENTVYRIFDATNGTLSGWTTLDKSNFTVNGSALTSLGRVQLSLGERGTFSYSILGAQTITWVGGSSTEWNTTDANWDFTPDADAANNEAFYNGDSVIFNTDANVTVTEAVSANNLTVRDDATVSITETAALRAQSIEVQEGATLAFASTKNGYTAANISGDGTVELKLSNNYDNAVRLEGFDGELYVNSGRFDLYTSTAEHVAGSVTADDDSDNVAQLGTKLHVGQGVNMKLTSGKTVVMDADMVLSAGNHEIHHNGGAILIVNGDVTGEGTWVHKGTNGTLTFSETGSVTLGGFSTGSAGTISFNATTTLGTANLTQGAVTFANTTDIGSATISGGTMTFNGVTTLGAVTISGGTTTFANTADITTATITGGTVNFNGATDITTATLSGGTLNVGGEGKLDVDRLTVNGDVSIANSKLNSASLLERDLGSVSIAEGKTLTLWTTPNGTVNENAKAAVTWTVESLSGAGTLKWDSWSYHDFKSSQLVLKGDGSGFTGEIFLNRRFDTRNGPYQTYLVLASDDAAKKATVRLKGNAANGTASLAVNTANANVGGLISDTAHAHLYAGAAPSTHNAGQQASTAANTLTITGAGEYTFSGTVGKSGEHAHLNLAMTGTGSQTFSGVAHVGDVSVSNGTLALSNTNSKVYGDITVSGGSLTFAGSYTLGEGQVLSVLTGTQNAVLLGGLTLSGGELAFDASLLSTNTAALSLGSAVVYTAGTTQSVMLDFSKLSGDLATGSYLLAGGDWSGENNTTLAYNGMGAASLEATANGLYLHYTHGGIYTWVGGAENTNWSAANWDVTPDTNADNNVSFAAGKDVIFNTNANVMVDTAVVVGVATVQNGAQVTLDKSGDSASLTAESVVVQDGKLTLGGGKNWTGISEVTVLADGVLELAHLSTVTGADIILRGGEMQLLNGAWSNYEAVADILVDGSGSIRGSFNGDNSKLSGTISGVGTLNFHAYNTYWNNPVTVSSLISDGAAGPLSLHVTNGTVKLTGTNTYTGATTVSGGTLELAHAGALNSHVTVNAGALFRLEATSAKTFAKTISGAGSVEKTGAGTLTLTGANTYTGATTVSGGTLELTGTVSMAAGSSISLANGTTLLLNTTNATAMTLGNDITGTGTIHKKGGYETVLSGNIAANLITVRDYSTGNNGENLHNAGVLTLTGDTVTANQLYLAYGTLNIGGTAKDDTTFMAVQKVEIGDSNQGDATTELNVRAGATLTVTGDSNGTGGNTGHKNASFLLAEWLASSTLNVAGKVLVPKAKAVFGDDAGTININGGILAVQGISEVRSGHDNTGIALNLSDNGKLIMGEPGLQSSKPVTAQLGTGTVGMFADTTTIAENVTLTSAEGTTFDTTQYTFVTNTDKVATGIERGTEAGSMTVTGDITSAADVAAKMKVAGNGELLLTGNANVSGGLEVEKGAVLTTAALAMGSTAGADSTAAAVVKGAVSISATEGTARIEGTDDAPGRIDNSLITLAQGASLTVDNMIISESSRISGKAAAATFAARQAATPNVTLTNSTIELGHGNAELTGGGAPITINPGKLTSMDGSATDVWMTGAFTALRVESSALDSLTLNAGSSFLVDFSSLLADVSIDNIDLIELSFSGVAFDSMSDITISGVYNGHQMTAYYLTPADTAVANVGSVYFAVDAIPEPTTSTLSLLALAALAARRRRK